MYSVDIGLPMEYRKKGLVTVNVAAQILGVSVQTLRRWDKKNKLKPIRHPMNNYRLYKVSEIKQLLEELHGE